MKKIMLIFISVVMLFTACEKQTENITDTSIEASAPTQIDPSEEFDGVLFGMTKDEVIGFLGKDPDFIFEPDDNSYDYNYIAYHDEEHFNVSAAAITYCFTRYDGALRRMIYEFSRDESEHEQLISDCEVIKEEIINRYPEEICTFFSDDETDLTIYTENRSIFLHVGNTLIRVFVDEYLPGIYDTRYDEEDENEPVEETLQLQIDPSEEFGGITFGMTQDEVIKIHGKEPSFTFENGDITYMDETYFNIDNAQADYYFDENGKLYAIDIMFRYEDLEDSSFQSDYDSIREEILRRYPGEVKYFTDTDNTFTHSTDNRYITLSRYIVPLISVRIENIEK